jgi:hypothetical protein
MPRAAKRARRPEIDHEVEFRGFIDWEITRFRPARTLVDGWV